MSKKLLHCWKKSLPYLRYRAHYFRLKLHTSTQCPMNDTEHKLSKNDGKNADSTKENATSTQSSNVKPEQKTEQDVQLQEFTKLIHDEFRAMKYIEDFGLQSSVENIRSNLNLDEETGRSSVSELKLENYTEISSESLNKFEKKNESSSTEEISDRLSPFNICSLVDESGEDNADVEKLMKNSNRLSPLGNFSSTKDTKRMASENFFHIEKKNNMAEESLNKAVSDESEHNLWTNTTRLSPFKRSTLVGDSVKNNSNGEKVKKMSSLFEHFQIDNEMSSSGNVTKNDFPSDDKKLIQSAEDLSSLNSTNSIHFQKQKISPFGHVTKFDIPKIDKKLSTDKMSVQTPVELSPLDNYDTEMMTVSDKNKSIQNTIPEDALTEMDELPPPEEIEDFPLKESFAFEPSFNLAPYVDQSEVLTNLVRLGVDLSVIEKQPKGAEVLVNLDYHRDVIPRLFFLKEVGIADDELASVITKNPFIFDENIENLEVKINYFKSKLFTNEDIAKIVRKAPGMLTMNVIQIDGVLGSLQKTFEFTGDELRETVRRFPQLIKSCRAAVFKEKQFLFKEVFGFTDVQQKKIFLQLPRLLAGSDHDLTKKFDYLHNIMEFNHDRLVQYPNIFRCRLFHLKQRHQYLVSLGRAQYDPTKENYVSLQKLVSGNDNTWCLDVAKTSVKEYNRFLKTL